MRVLLEVEIPDTGVSSLVAVGKTTTGSTGVRELPVDVAATVAFWVNTPASIVVVESIPLADRNEVAANQLS